MLTIEESYPTWENIASIAGATEKSFSCPVCNAPHSFYFMSSMTAFCTICSSRIVDIDRLLNDKAYQLKYHFNMIDDKGRRTTDGCIHKETS